MFGYKIIKSKEIENLKSELANAKETIESQEKNIAKLLDTIKEQEGIILSLIGSTKVKSEIIEDKPVKKVRRKNSKKTTKKED